MAFHDYFDEKMYHLQGTAEMRELQEKKLIANLNDNYAANEVFRLGCLAKGVSDLSGIRTLDDFKAAFPVGEEPRSQMEAIVNGPLWKGTLKETMAYVQGVKPEDYVLLCATSGTTGIPTPYFFTESGMQTMARGFSRSCYMSGTLPGKTVVHAMALSMFGAGVPLVETFIRLGITTIPVGAEVGKEKLIQFSEYFKPEVIFCTPSYAQYLVDTVPDKIRDIGFSRVICGGEPGAGIPEVRKKIQEGFGCNLTDMMGLIGGLALTSCDLEEYAGMHHLSDDLFYFELVDPETKQPVPFEDGAVGQLLTTTLEGPMSPRGTSGDVAQVFTSPCKCGNPGWRIKIVGRIDDMLKVKGVIVYPSHIDDAVKHFFPRVTGEFRIVLDVPPPRVEPPLKLKVEYGEGVNPGDLEGLEAEIGEYMHNRLRIRPQIQWIAPMGLERTALKTRFIEKAYEQKK
jgi:phenylacetate-CoA ligase